MENKTQINLIQGDEFGIFDYTDLDETEREQKWMVLSYMIEQGKVRSEDVGTLFQNNPFFF